jgi:hypothetical protein
LNLRLASNGVFVEDVTERALHASDLRADGNWSRPSAERVAVRPPGASKSMTLSMMAHASLDAYVGRMALSSGA